MANKRFKVGDRVKVTIHNKFLTEGQTGIITHCEIVNIGKGFWSYSVKLDSPIPGSAKSYILMDDEIEKIKN
jgi:hypothetical protein